MPTAPDLDPDAVLADVRRPASPPATMPGQGSWSLRRAARIAGAAYLLTDAGAIFSEFFVRPSLIVSGDAARTASNIAAHAQLFRAGLVSDLLTAAGVVVLNLMFYELLAPVHRSLARFVVPPGRTSAGCRGGCTGRAAGSARPWSWPRTTAWSCAGADAGRFAGRNISPRAA